MAERYLNKKLYLQIQGGEPRKIDKDSTQDAVGAWLSIPDLVMNVIRNVEIDVPETWSASDQGSSLWSDDIEELESGIRLKTCSIVHASNDSDGVQLYENVEAQ